MGVVGVSGGFSTVVEASGLNTESKKLEKKTLNRFLKSQPVKNLLEKMGASFEESGPNTVRLNLLERPTKSRIVHEDNTIVSGVQLKTDGGIIGLILRDGAVHQAVFIVTEKIRSLKSDTEGYSAEKDAPIDTEATEGEVNGSMVLGQTDGVTYTREMSDNETAEVNQKEEVPIENGTVVEKEEEIFYVYDVNERPQDYESKNYSKVTKVRKKATGELVGEKQHRRSDGIQRDDVDCDLDGLPGCVLDLADSSYYCYLAGQACNLSRGFGVPGLVSCLAAIVSLCGGRIVLATLSGSCADVAGCVDNFCNENPLACPGGLTPIPPV